LPIDQATACLVLILLIGCSIRRVETVQKASGYRGDTESRNRRPEQASREPLRRRVATRPGHSHHRIRDQAWSGAL